MAAFEKTTGLRSHVGKKIMIFYCKYAWKKWPTVSRRRDESKCHQVCIFIDQSERRCPRKPFKAPLPRPLEPLIASSVWGIMKIGLKWVHMARYGLIQPPKWSYGRCAFFCQEIFTNWPRGPKKRPTTPKQFCLGVPKRGPWLHFFQKKNWNFQNFKIRPFRMSSY